jgi:hypothetical protein
MCKSRATCLAGFGESFSHLTRARGPKSGLRIIALTSASGQASLRNVDFQLVVLVGLAALGWIERKLVVGARIGEALSQHFSDVVAGGKNNTTALARQYLQC